MENASKALIIAGSILVTIIVISLGIVVFNNFRKPVENNTSLDTEIVAQFNGKIRPYVGNNISGSQVRALAQLIRSIDQTAINNKEDIKRVSLYINNSEKKEAIYSLRAGETAIGGTKNVQVIKTNKYYKVETTSDANGLITEIVITENS